MTNCEQTRKDVAALLDGTLAEDREAGMKKHLETCPECRRARDEVEQIIAGADAEREDLRRAMAAVDWETLPEQIAAAAWAAGRGPASERVGRPFWTALGMPRWRPVLAAALGGVMIGAVAMYFAVHPPVFRRAGASPSSASADFVDRAELRLAKQETIDYLDRSQVLILDVLQRSAGPGEELGSDRTADLARGLLSKKRFINPELDRTQMVKAREICNQIETLFFALSQMSDEITAEEASRIKTFVEQRQLLLNIKLLRKELAESGV
jgi:hypothetical protein